MNISDAERERIRVEARFACQYCGVTEIECGTVTIDRLRLNRPELIAHRLRRRLEAATHGYLRQHQDTLASIEATLKQQVEQLREQRKLLREQNRLLAKLRRPKG
jgi:hypothetical protein